MVFSELALGYLTNLIYDSSKKIPREISDTYSKVYDKAIEEFSNKHYKLNGMQIEVFFRQKKVETAIEKYLKIPDKLDCLNALIQEFFELFREEDFSREDADLILNTFFEIIETEIEKYPELIVYLDHYLAKRTDKTVQETKQGVQELSQDVKEISQTVQEIRKVVNENREDQNRKKLNEDFDESIKKYLNKIIEDKSGTEISELYTELSAKEILPITLKLRDEENNKTQEFEVLELVEKEEKLIIYGESGSGKTTTLRWLNYIFAKSYLEGKNENVPLYIELNSYIGEERFIKKPFDAYVAMKAEGKGITKDTLKTILEGKAIILLDGFDLLSPTDEFHPYHKISNFITDYNNCRFVISSRPGFFESIKSGFRVSELEKLTDEKIEIFIKRYVSNEELANILKDKILSNQQLKSILSNSMMLYIAIKVAMGRKDKSGDLLPSNRSELYDAFISTLFNHHEEKGKLLHADRAQIENALTDLYFKLQCRNEVSCKYGEALKIVKKSAEDDTFRKTTSQDILEDCFKIGLLVKNNSEIGYGVHQSFQEYFAAIKLKELFETGFDISEAFSHPRWEEVVIFASERLDSIDELINLMLLKKDQNRVFQPELFLASKCISRASEKTKEKLCTLLADKTNSNYELEKIISIESLSRLGVIGISIAYEALKQENEFVIDSAAEAFASINSEKEAQLLINELKKDEDMWLFTEVVLGSIRSEKTIQPLIGALKDENRFVRLGAIRALGNIKSEKAVQPLIDALIDKSLSWTVAEALGKIKSEKAVQPLISALKDEEEEVRWSAAAALGKIKSEKAVQPLIDTLKDENRVVRWYAAEALRKIKSEKAIQPLIDALNDEDGFVRSVAVATLGIIKSEKAVQSLINALDDEDEFLRSIAAEALGNVKSEKAIQPLINALNDEEEEVRHSAAEALGNIKSEKVVQPLINALKDKDEFMWWGAAEALGKMGSEEAVHPLINALNDEDDFVRSIAVEALGNIKSEEAIQPLINALNDEEEEVRWSAAEALGKIESKKAVQPLISVLKDEDVNVRLCAVRALGKIKSENAIKPLIDTLKDEDEEVRWCAAEALGNIESEKAVQPLISALKDEDEDVRWRAVEALGKIKSDKAVQPLISALKDEDVDVRWSAIEALENIKSDKAVQLLISALKDEDEDVQWSAAEVLKEIVSRKNKRQIEDLLKSENKFSVNAGFEILYEIEKEEKSELILFKDLKKRSKITPKYSIFVSSVQKELENERVTIQDLVENDPFLSEHYTSLLYEYEPAYPEKTLEGCLNALNRCQVYLLIVWMKYGTLVGDISITHTEYRYAKEKNIPILVFIKGERNIEREQGTDVLLREIESDDFKYKRFWNVKDLKNEVNESLKKLLQEEDKFLKI